MRKEKSYEFHLKNMKVALQNDNNGVKPNNKNR